MELKVVINQSLVGRAVRMVWGLALAVFMSQAAFAGPIEDATAADEAGDYGKAVSILMPMAEAGDALASMLIGAYYLDGQGLPKDPLLAEKYLLQAAGQRAPVAPLAAAELGELYYKGQGALKKDTPKAVFWYNKAAEFGITKPMIMLSVLLSSSPEVPRDTQKAAAWALIAQRISKNEGEVKMADLYAKLLIPKMSADERKQLGEKTSAMIDVIIANKQSFAK